MMIKQVPTNDCEIRVNAKSAGDYGIFRISGVQRTPKEEYRACEEIVSEIKRHVDNVGWTHIAKKNLYETEDGNQFETLYEALEHLYDEEGCAPCYEYRYERPSDKGVGTRGSCSDFKDLIVAAYQNPNKFTLVTFSYTVPLTEIQNIFLERVIEAALSPSKVGESA